MQNDKNIAVLWFRASIHHFNIPLNIIKKASQTCKLFNNIARIHLQECEQLRAIWGVKIKNALYMNLLKSYHPFSYEKTFFRKISPISARLQYTHIIHMPNSIENLRAGYNIAFSNLMVTLKIPCMFILRIYMNGHFVLKVMARAHLSDNIINLNLVTRYNPICLFDIDDHPRALEFRFTFAQKYDTQNITSIIFVLK